MKIRDDTIKLFKQDKEDVIEYLKSRKFTNKTLFAIIKDYPFGLVSGADFIVSSEEYSISHFLSKSDISGYDIKSVNETLGLSETDVVAFAMVVGDDVLCYDTKEKRLFLWLIQTQDGDKIEIEDTLSEFLNGIINND